MADPWQIAELLVTLQVLSAIAIVLIIIRRPEQFAERLRRIFGSVADIAGFWAPTCTHSPAPHIVAHCCPGSDRRSTTWFWNIRTLRSRCRAQSGVGGVRLVRSRRPLDRTTDGRGDRSPRAQDEHAPAGHQPALGPNRVVHLWLTVVHAVPDVLSPLLRRHVLRQDVGYDLQELLVAQLLAED